MQRSREWGARGEMEISFRPVTADDFDFLWHLHNAAFRKYIEETWGWNEDWQRKHFSETFDPGVGRIVMVDGNDAGYIWVSEGEDEIFLASIRILPEYQGRGVGTRLIRDLIESDKTVRLDVLKVNPARELYERLGFSISSDLGTHFEMIRKP